MNRNDKVLTDEISYNWRFIKAKLFLGFMSYSCDTLFCGQEWMIMNTHS